MNKVGRGATINSQKLSKKVGRQFWYKPGNVYNQELQASKKEFYHKIVATEKPEIENVFVLIFPRSRKAAKSIIGETLTKYPLSETTLSSIEGKENLVATSIKLIVKTLGAKPFEVDRNYSVKGDRNFKLWTELFKNIGMDYSAETLCFDRDKAVEKINSIKVQFAELKKVIMHLYLRNKLDHKTCSTMINNLFLKQIISSMNLLTPKEFTD